MKHLEFDYCLMELRVHGVVQTRDGENFDFTDQFKQEYVKEISRFIDDKTCPNPEMCALINTMARLMYPHVFHKNHVKVVVAIADVLKKKGFQIRNITSP